MNLPTHDKNHPFLATLIARYPLTRPGSAKDTQHLVLSIKGSNIEYMPGDSIAIFPHNDPLIVELTLRSLHASGEEEIITKQEEKMSLKEFLTSRANLKGVNRKIVQAIKQRVDLDQQFFFEELFLEENKDRFKVWMHTHEIWDLLQKYPEVHFSLQEFISFLMPLLPRFYSIASSQAYVGDEIHLTIAHLRYETNGISRSGVCTRYLCEHAKLNEPSIPIYIQSGHAFRLPENDSTPMIMIGPGTGIAPFRAFMQEREIRQSTGKHWIFFGDWTRSHEFFYEEEWKRLVEKGILRFDTAFSRDQVDKVYVQHKMLEASQELFQWIEEGAVIYVCGDAHYMAKDVDVTLQQIVQKEGHMSQDEAVQYMKQLRHDKRYLRDIY